MPVLQNLEGTNGDKETRFFFSPRQAISLLLRGYAPTASGDNGAINVWKDDHGKYHCQFMRFCQTQDQQTFDSPQEIIPWLKVWLKKTQN